jgi:hypothetical protein
VLATTALASSVGPVLVALAEQVDQARTVAIDGYGTYIAFLLCRPSTENRCGALGRKPRRAATITSAVVMSLQTLLER